MSKHNKALHTDNSAALGVSSPHIEIEKNALVSVEGYVSILEYDESYIKIECEDITVKITGDSLGLSNILSERINVTGDIISVEFL